MKNKQKWSWIIVVFVLLVSCISVAVFTEIGTGMNKEVLVTTVDVKKQDISTCMLVKGKLESVVKSEITSDFAYRIDYIYVNIGDKVKKGDILAKFDIKQLSYDIECAKLELQMEEEQYNEKSSEESTLRLQKDIEIQEDEVDTLKAKYENNKALFEAGAISKDELDTIYSEYLKSKNSLDKSYLEMDKLIKDKNKSSDQTALKLKRLILAQKIESLNQTSVTSPIDGTITEINAKIGAIPKGAGGLFVIEDLTKLKTTFYINEFDIAKLKVGTIVKLTTESIPGKTFKGKITNIYPTAQTEKSNSSGSQTVIPVEVELYDDITGLRPGITIESNIEIERAEDVFALPYEAIYEKTDKTCCVFAVRNGVLEEIPVELGVQSDLTVELISDKLKAGDKVILNPDETHKNGMKVRIKNL